MGVFKCQPVPILYTGMKIEHCFYLNICLSMSIYMACVSALENSSGSRVDEYSCVTWTKTNQTPIHQIYWKSACTKELLEMTIGQEILPRQQCIHHQ